MEHANINSRRFPRVPYEAVATIDHRSERRSGVTRDVGPGGCLVLANEPLARGAVLRIVLSSDAVAEPLSASGRVAWANDRLTGVEFTASTAAEASRWFDRLLAHAPELRGGVYAVPSTLSLADFVSVSRAHTNATLNPDEALILRQLDGSSLAVTVARSGLALGRGTRAILGLFEKGVLSIQQDRAPDPARPRRVLDPLTREWRPAPMTQCGPLNAGDLLPIAASVVPEPPSRGYRSVYTSGHRSSSFVHGRAVTVRP